MVHYQMTMDDLRGTAVADTRRARDGLINEHCDIVQPVPESGDIPHGMD